MQTNVKLLFRPNLVIKSVISGHPIEERGTLQLWMPQIFPTDKHRERRESITSSTNEIATSSNRSNRLSGTSLSLQSPTGGNFSPSIRESVAGSEMALFHTMPKKPLLVLFLQSTNPNEDHLALVAVELDEETAIKRELCQCGLADANCRVACMQQKNAHFLSAQRFDAGTDLNQMNLEFLSINQRKELPHAAWRKVNRLSFTFANADGMTFANALFRRNTFADTS
jgi:hypothetical protein